MVTGCLTINIYFYLFLYLYITRITINNGTPHLKSERIKIEEPPWADVIEAFNSASRYFDDLLNIDNLYFEGMVSQIYLAELQLNKTNTSNTKASFYDLHLLILK